MAETSELPLKEIPGGYGTPFFGAVNDRVEFFDLGDAGFVQKKIDTYNSTVLRTNMAPGPPGFPDPRVILLADQSSFKVLFDMDKVMKKDLFTGTYMPSTSFTGGFRVLPYLDPVEDEEDHTKLKKFCFWILSSNASKWFPEFEEAINEAFLSWENEIEKNGKVGFADITGDFTFKFLARSALSKDANLAKAPSYIQWWQVPQLLPIASAGYPKCIEQTFLHSFPLPFCLVAWQYKKIADLFEKYGTVALDYAEKELGLNRKQALHNLIFFICFNTYGGIQILFPALINRISVAGEDLQKKLREEIRSAVEENGGKIDLGALEKMELLHSTVYETLRIEPPVKWQYGRARKDIVISSHTAAFKVKKGEMLAGFQPSVTTDPLVFDNPHTFMADRFLGAQGHNLLQYVYWSNGPETCSPSIHNKQCAGKDFVVMIARLFVAHMFLRYDYFQFDQPLVKGSSTTYTFIKLQRALH